MIDYKYAEASSPPSKAIWDLDSGDEGEGTKATVSLTSASGGISHSSPHMDAVQLRVQLWDSYRLARIILGVPIKSFNLESKAILNAIRVTAEMKMELIRLNERVKELEVCKLEEETNGSILPTNAVEETRLFQENLNGEYQEQSDLFEALQFELSDMIGATERNLETSVEHWQEAPEEAKGELHELLKNILQKAEKTSQESRGKLTGLQQTLVKSQQQSLEHAEQLQQLQRKFQTKKTLHQIEMESFKSKHLQQIMDLSGQLGTYKEQVESQHEEIGNWQDQYHELENLAVTPEQAHDVLHAINQITEDSSIDEQMEVQGQVVEILQKMSQLYTKQANNRAELQATVKAANRKEAKSKEELKDLKVQEEILVEETKVTAQDWRDALAAQKEFCERQIDDIMSREENRQMEMEVLELKLTELAFASVEIEDLQNEVKQNRESHSIIVERANADGESSARSIAKIQNQVDKIIIRQKESIQHLVASKPSGSKWKALLERKNKIDRLGQLEMDLAQRNEELCTTREDLSKSQATIQLLEHKLSLAEARCNVKEENLMQ
jgi:hypothetical protein